MEKEDLLSCHNQIQKLYKLEGIKWRQHAKENWIREGDANTAYFQKIANWRRRTDMIFAVDMKMNVFEKNNRSIHIFTSI